MVRVEGFEPPTPPSQAECAARLRYTRIGYWWSWRQDSNLQLAIYGNAALPIELRQHLASVSSSVVESDRA